MVTLKRLLVSFAVGKRDRRKGGVFRTYPKNTPYGILTLLGGVKGGATFVKGIKGSRFKTLLESAVARTKVSTSGLVISRGIGAALTFMRAFPSKSERFSFCHGPKTSVVLATSRIGPRMMGSAGIFRFKALSVARRNIHRTAGGTMRATGTGNYLMSFSPGLEPPL